MASPHICNAKGCNVTVPTYCRYCIKHESEICIPDIIIISTQPTIDSQFTTANENDCCCCCGDGCCVDGCCESEDDCCED